MQDNATPEQRIVHHAREFIAARDEDIRVRKQKEAASVIDAARDMKHKKERALDRAVKDADRKPQHVKASR